MILADKIIRLRKKLGWSQEELAEKMNVSRQAVSKWEGKRLDDIQKQREIGKRPYQRILLAIGSALITFAVCVLIGFLMHIFLN